MPRKKRDPTTFMPYTPKERRMLAALMRFNAGRRMTTSELVGRVYDERPLKARESLTAMMARLMMKVECNGEDFRIRRKAGRGKGVQTEYWREKVR